MLFQEYISLLSNNLSLYLFFVLAKVLEAEEEENHRKKIKTSYSHLIDR